MKTIIPTLEESESNRQALQIALDSELSSADRNRLGQFATPHALAVEIIRYLVRDWPAYTQNVRFADPSLGSGSFFSAALKVFGKKQLRSSLGIEIDPRFASVATELWSQWGLEVVEGDFTRICSMLSQSPSPNLILANPPYVRHHHLLAAEKARLQALVREKCGVQVSGLAGLYVYFFLLATHWMSEGGIAAWLVPSEFMDVNYGATLKQYLTSQVALDRIHRFDPSDLQFGDALVSSAVLFFRKEPPTEDHQVAFTFGGTLELPAVTQRVANATLKSSRKWTVYPIHAQNDRSLSTNQMGLVLGDLFRIQRGVATGCNDFFILKRSLAESQGLVGNYLKPVLPSPRNLKATVIESDSAGFPQVDPQLCLIDSDLPESAIKNDSPALWKYLQTADDLGIKAGYLIGKRSPWYRQEQRLPAPFLCTYMGRGEAGRSPFRFIWNRSQAIATNLYLMLYPQKALAKMLSQHPDRAEDVFVLLNEVTGSEMRGEGRVYGGGLNKIEPRELGRISVSSWGDRWPELQPGPMKQSIRNLFD